MGIIVSLVNKLMMMLYKKSATEFYSDLNKVDSVQEKLLMDIINRNKDTVYGKKHNFASVKSIDDYRKTVPITTYGDYKAYIDDIANGGENILTSSKINMFEVTGGSGGHVKLIPYTAELKSEFLQGIKPWIYSLYKAYPAVRRGKSYWSITPPAFEKKFTPAGIPIGFEDDTAYFGKIEQFLTDLIFARDKNLHAEKDMDKFYFKTCLCLLKEKNLSLISVWNPSYLLILLRYITENSDALIQALPKKRKAEISGYIKNCDWQKIWHNLTVISCWCDGLAKSGSDEIRSLFTNVYVQPKGILATEAFMTLPYFDSSHSILSYKSHYFEFIDCENGEILSYTNLILGKKYEIIFTTSGGFYRYKINDTVMVADFESNSLPLLKFVGKNDKTADYHGEKLNELFLREIFETIYANEKYANEHNLNDRFKLIAYENSRYMLFLQEDKNDNIDFITELEHRIETLLCESYHYKLCRDLSQLKPLRICVVRGDLKQAYLNFYVDKGKKLGDIKPELLSLQSGWLNAFKDGGNI